MATTNRTNNRVRTVGSGFTIFTWQHQPIAFAQQIAHTSPQPVAAPEAIQPIDEPYPVQVITPAASGMGTLTLNLYELYNSKVWERLGATYGLSDTPTNVGDADPGRPWTLPGSADDNDFLVGAIDLVDVFIRVAAHPGAIGVSKIIRPPTLGGNNAPPYSEEYHNCVITNVIDGEQVEVGTMSVIKQITVAYTHMSRNGKYSKAFSLSTGAITNPNWVSQDL